MTTISGKANLKPSYNLEDWKGVGYSNNKVWILKPQSTYLQNMNRQINKKNICQESIKENQKSTKKKQLKKSLIQISNVSFKSNFSCKSNKDMGLPKYYLKLKKKYFSQKNKGFFNYKNISKNLYNFKTIKIKIPYKIFENPMIKTNENSNYKKQIFSNLIDFSINNVNSSSSINSRKNKNLHKFQSYNQSLKYHIAPNTDIFEKNSLKKAYISMEIPIGLKYPISNIMVEVNQNINIFNLIPSLENIRLSCIFTIYPTLPIGIKINTTTGKLYGIPKEVGATIQINIYASNQFGTAVTSLLFTVIDKQEIENTINEDDDFDITTRTRHVYNTKKEAVDVFISLLREKQISIKDNWEIVNKK